MNKLFLKLALLPSGFWRGMGADTDQLKAILDVRLKMDDRKPVLLGRQQRKATKSSSAKTIFISLVMGAIYMFPLLLVKDAIFGLSIFLGLMLVWLSLMLITDFSNILFDTRDKYIILPCPVNDRTLVLSRLLHVFIYLARIILPLSIPAWIVLGIRFGWQPVVLFPFLLLLLVCMALFFVNSWYLFLLRFTSAQRFKEIINYFQIAASIIFFATLYLMPRAFDPGKGTSIIISDYAWIKYLPSYWLAVCLHWFDVSRFTVVLTGTEWFGLLAVLMPIVCFIILIKWLAPQFARSIGGLDTVDTAENKSIVTSKTASGKQPLYQKLANIMNRDEVVKAGFIITWLQTSRSRTFKMRVFPSFAYVPVYFVYQLTQNGDSFSDMWHNMPNKPYYILLLYMCAFVMMNAMNYLSISEQFKSAWVYYAAPLQTPGKVLSGAFKALWLKYLVPFFTVLTIFIVGVWGLHTILDIILALVNVTLFAICMIRVGARHFPFSVAEQINESGARILKAFLSMFLVFALGITHFLLVKYNVLGVSFILKLVFLFLSSAMTYLAWTSYANTSWKDIKQADMQ